MKLSDSYRKKLELPDTQYFVVRRPSHFFKMEGIEQPITYGYKYIGSPNSNLINEYNYVLDICAPTFKFDYSATYDYLRSRIETSLSADDVDAEDWEIIPSYAFEAPPDIRVTLGNGIKEIQYIRADLCMVNSIFYSTLDSWEKMQKLKAQFEAKRLEEAKRISIEAEKDKELCEKQKSTELPDKKDKSKK